MRSPHDMGGLPGQPIDRTEHALAPWEKRVNAIMMLLAKQGVDLACQRPQHELGDAQGGSRRSQEKLVRSWHVPPRVVREARRITFPLDHGFAVAGDLNAVAADLAQQAYRVLGWELASLNSGLIAVPMLAIQVIKSASAFPSGRLAVQHGKDLFVADHQAKMEPLRAFLPVDHSFQFVFCGRRERDLQPGFINFRRHQRAAIKSPLALDRVLLRVDQLEEVDLAGGLRRRESG